MSRLRFAPSNLTTTYPCPALLRHGSLWPGEHQTRLELRFPSEPRAVVLTLRFHRTLRPPNPPAEVPGAVGDPLEERVREQTGRSGLQGVP